MNLDISKNNSGVVRRVKELTDDIAKLERLKKNKDIQLELLEGKLGNSLNKLSKVEGCMVTQYDRSKLAAKKLGDKDVLIMLGNAKPVYLFKLSRKRLDFFKKLGVGHLERVNLNDINNNKHFILKFEHALREFLKDSNDLEKKGSIHELILQLKYFVFYCKQWADILNLIDQQEEDIIKYKKYETEEINTKIRRANNQLESLEKRIK